MTIASIAVTAQKIYTSEKILHSRWRTRWVSLTQLRVVVRTKFVLSPESREQQIHE